MQLTGMSTLARLQSAHHDGIKSTLQNKPGIREAFWTESIAVGRAQYIETVQAALGHRAIGRQSINEEGKYLLKEPDISYRIDFNAKKAGLSH